MLSIQDIKNGVAQAAQEYPITKVELFGSYAKGTNKPGSDVDLLMEFTTSSVSLLMLIQIKHRLEELLNTEVDVIHGPLEEDSIIEIDRSIPLYGA